MANILEIILKAVKQGSGFKQTEADVTSLSKATAGLNKILGAAGVAVSAQQLIAYGQAAVAAARESAAAEAQLEAVLLSTGNAAGVTKEQLIGMATALENSTLFSDEAIMKGEELLLTFTKIGKDVFPQATQAIADMSARFGTDLSGSAVQLGKALNSPIAGLAALTRIGIQFTDQQRQQVAAMMQVGDIAGAQGIILAEISTQTAGAAQAARDAAGGAADYAVSVGRLQEAMGNLLLTIGDAGATDAATGWIDRLAAGAGAWTGVIENIQLLSEAQAKLAEESGEVEIAQRGAMGQVAGSAEAYSNAESALSSLIGWFVEGETAQEGFAEAVQEVASATSDATSVIAGTPAKVNPAQRAVKAYADSIRDLTDAQLENANAPQTNNEADAYRQMAMGRVGMQDAVLQNENDQNQRASDKRRAQQKEDAAESERLFKESTSAMVKATNELGSQIESAVSSAVSQSSTDIAALLGITPEGEQRVNEGVRRMAAVATGGLANEWTQGLAEQLKGVDAAQAFVNAVASGNESAVKDEARKLALAPIVELFDVNAMATSIEQKLRGQDLNGQLNQRIQKILSEKGLDTSIDAISQVAQGTQEVATQATTSVGTIGAGATSAGETITTAFSGAVPSIDTLILRIVELNKMLERTKVLAGEAGSAIAGLNPPMPGANGNGVPSDAQRALGGPAPL